MKANIPRTLPHYWTVPLSASVIGAEQSIDKLVLHYCKYGCACACVCGSKGSEVGGLHSLSLYNTKPHWYFEKEINIAISSGSCVSSVYERVCVLP